MEAATVVGGGEDAGARAHTRAHKYTRAVRGWGDGAGGDGRPRGKSCFVVMFFLFAEASLSACVFDTQ